MEQVNLTKKIQGKNLEFFSMFIYNYLRKICDLGKEGINMAEIKLNLKHSSITQKSILEYKHQIEIIHKDLHRRAELEDDFVGWLELPTNYDKKEFSRIKKAAKKIKKESDVLVVIRNRWFLFRSKSGNRSFNKYFQRKFSNKANKKSRNIVCRK